MILRHGKLSFNCLHTRSLLLALREHGRRMAWAGRLLYAAGSVAGWQPVWSDRGRNFITEQVNIREVRSQSLDKRSGLLGDSSRHPMQIDGLRTGCRRAGVMGPMFRPGCQCAVENIYRRQNTHMAIMVLQFAMAEVQTVPDAGIRDEG